MTSSAVVGSEQAAGDERRVAAARAVDRHAEVSLSAGVLRLLVGRGLSLALNFLAWALIARALQPSAFGFLQFAISIIVYVTFVTDLGLTTLGTRELATTRELPLIRQILGLRAALAVVALSAAILGMLVFTDATATRWVWAIMLSTVAAAALNAVWVLRALGKSMALALVDVLSSVTLFVGAAIVWLFYRDPILAAAVVALGQWLAAGLSALWVGDLRWLSPTLQSSFRHLRAAMPLGVAVLAVSVYYSLDTVLLGLMRTKAEVGYYAAAYKLVLPWLLIASIVGHLAMPALARLSAERPDALRASLRRLSAALTVFGLSAAVGVALLAPLLVETIFGITYAPAAMPLAILIWSCVTVFANAPFGFLMLARRQDRAYMWTALSGAAINLALNAVLIPLHGMIGAAIATIAAEVTVLSLMLWLTRDVSFPIVSRSTALAVPVALVVAVGMWPFANSLLAIPVGIAIFAVGALATRVVTIAQLRDVVAAASGKRR